MPARMLAWLAIVVSVGGCDSGGLDHTTFSDLGRDVPDLAMVPAPSDLAIAAYPDLTVAATPDLGPFSCAAMVACTRACNTGQCAGDCIQHGSADAMIYFTPLQQCAGPACSDANTGAAPCTDPSSNACLQCVVQSCGAQLDACMNH